MGNQSDISFTESIENLLVSASTGCPSCVLGKDEALERALFRYDAEDLRDIGRSGLQAGCAVDNVEKARALAKIFVTEEGELLLQKVALAKRLLEERLYSIGFGCDELASRNFWLHKAIKFLAESAEAQRIIRKMVRPLSNRLAENTVRDTLLLPGNQPMQDGHVRQAAVAALLTKLRQSLGSCFATAPAIVIHEEQSLLFLKDLEELVGTGRLKRTVAGNEYSVPMCDSWGQGDLKKGIVVTAPLEAAPQPFWKSSPLGRTLQEVELAPRGLPVPALQDFVLRLVEDLFRGTPALTTVDDILQKLLLKKVGLSEKDLHEFQGRPKAMRQLSMVVAKQASSGPGAAKEGLFARFFALLEQARRAFKAEADCALLKSWEFTVASFAEVKFNLCTWNFYSSLGVNWDDRGGIGQILYEFGKQEVEETALKLEQHRQKFDALSLEVDYLSRRMQQAGSESEAQWIKMEHQSRQVEQYHIRELCDMASEKANKIAQLHQFLINRYEALLQEYFQEVYDADLHDVQAGPFDDSPAGFRLLYKHGRSNPSLWTRISSLEEYVDALVSFFSITEQELLHEPEVKGIEAEFSSIITRLATHVRSDEFIESALNRTAVAHGVAPLEHPLQHLATLEKKPWAYTSGGSMSMLVNAYFGLEQQAEVVDRWVENEVELLAFLIDTTRLSRSRSGRYQPQSLLMHSPTHAFLLQPQLAPFNESWSGDAYSYSWINTYVRDPFLAFYGSCVLDQEAVLEFCSLLAKRLPNGIQKRFLNEAQTIPGFLRPYELADEIQRLFSLDYVLRGYLASVQSSILDPLLFESVPYTKPAELAGVLIDIVAAVFPSEARRNRIESLARTLLSGIYSPVRAKDCLRLATALSVQLTRKVRHETDAFFSIVSACRAKGLLPPKPLVFADSNWVNDMFAFLIGPSSQQLEFWSVNAYATEGQPISHWKMWLNGSRKDRTWGIFVNPSQYRGAV